MSNTSRKFIAIGASFAGFAIITGAFGAHALKNILTTQSLTVYHTAVEYMFMHAIGLILIGILHNQQPNSCHKHISTLFIIGIVLFSGSLFTLSFSGIKWLGAITPFGGMCFIIGWFMFAYCYLKKSQ